MPMEDTAISLEDKHLELTFSATHRTAGNAEYVADDHIR